MLQIFAVGHRSTLYDRLRAGNSELRTDAVRDGDDSKRRKLARGCEPPTLLITNPGGTMSEAPVFCGLFQYNQQGTPFSLSAVFSPIGPFSIAN